MSKERAPKGFCKTLRYQPRIWDPSFLAVASTCWRKHWLQTVRGLRRNGDPSVHLTWGKAYHACVENYDRCILAGYSDWVAKEEAIYVAEAAASEGVWGETLETWRCTDPEMVPAKRLRIWQHRETGHIEESLEAARGHIPEEWDLVPKMIPNRGRCKFAKKAQAVGEEGLYYYTCECGQPIERGSTFVPFDPKKTGETLVTAVMAYCEQSTSTSIKPYRFPDVPVCQGGPDCMGTIQTKSCSSCDWKLGTAALELQARLPLPITSSDTWYECSANEHCQQEANVSCLACTWHQEPYEVLVNIDSLVEWEGQLAIRERKTTGRPFDWRYWAQFDPNVQIDTYDLVGSVLYPDEAGRPPSIMVEALKAGPEPEIQRHVVQISESRRAEWFGELQEIILEAEQKAEDVHAGIDPEVVFPRRTTACVQGFKVCPFLAVCQAGSAEERQELLARDFHVERWVPEDAESFVEESE